MNIKNITTIILAVLILLLDFFGSLYFIKGIKPGDLIKKINPKVAVNNLFFNSDLFNNKATETETNKLSDIELISDDLIKNKMISLINSRKLTVKLKSTTEYANLTPKIRIKAPNLTNESIYWERDFDVVSVKTNDKKNLFEFDISDFYQKGTFLLDINFYDEKGSSIFTLLNQEVIFGNRPKITSASVKNVDNKDLIVNITFAQEEVRPDPIWELYAVVCNKDLCAFAKKNMSDGWPKELKLDRKIEDRNLTITLIIKAKDLKGYVESYKQR